MRTFVPLVVIDQTTGVPIAAAEVVVTNRADGTSANVWSLESGGAPQSQPLLTDSGGRITGWLDRGRYTLAISVPGRSTYYEYYDSAPAADGAVDVNWLGAGSVSLVKAAADLLPSGMLIHYAGSTAPAGWLLCDGSAVNRVTYSALYAAIGLSYGEGDGATTFNLPDMRQRFALGKGVSGTGSALGQTGGAIDHTHTVTAHTHTVPAHTHPIPAHSHGVTNLSVTDSGHSHGVNDPGHGHGVSDPGHAHVTSPTSQLLGTALGVGSPGWGLSSFATGSNNFSHDAFASTTEFTRIGILGNPTGITLRNASAGIAVSGNVGNAAGSNGDVTFNTQNSTPVATDSQSPLTTAQNPPYVTVNYIIKI